jgi:CheY-like chemotaxis protein
VDVLISDVATPTMDRIALVENAFTVCHTLRRAFVLTASCDPRDLMQRVTDPRVSVHARPFSPSQLLRDLDDALRRAGLEGATDAISPTTEVIWAADSGPPPNAPGGDA